MAELVDGQKEAIRMHWQRTIASMSQDSWQQITRRFIKLLSQYGKKHALNSKSKINEFSVQLVEAQKKRMLWHPQ